MLLSLGATDVIDRKKVATSELQDAVQQVERAPFPGGLEAPERVKARKPKIAGSMSLRPTRRTELHAVYC